MTVEIQLTTVGIDSTTFDLYSNVDGFTIPFVGGLSAAIMLAGYTSTVVPDFTTIIRVQSTGTKCSNFIDIILATTTTTTTTLTPTTTTTTTIEPTTTTTTTTLEPTTTTTTTTTLEPTTTTSSTTIAPTTTTTTTNGSKLILDNNSNSNTIENVTGTNWTISIGTPTGPGVTTFGEQEGTTGAVSVEITVIVNGCISMYRNGVLIESINVTSTGVYTFSAIPITASDNIIFVLNDGSC